MSENQEASLTDEELARQLQEQFNNEVNTTKAISQQEDQLQKDMEFAQNLMNESNTDAKPMDTEQLKQFEIDMLLALKLQEQEYVEDKTKYTPKPVYNPPPVYPSFIRQQPDPDRLPPTPEAVKRITTDMKEVLLSKNKFIYIVPDEEDITHIQALIVGPPDTPYAYGFFHFDMIFPHDYPWRPPKVQIITTDGGQVRFNPNLYSNGKVCLSILGTWSGPSWTQIQTILSTLLSIQSLMNSTPYQNEPGYEMERKSGDIQRYNECITHETLRVAVCGMLENPTCGELFREEIEELFLEHYKEYVDKCEALKEVDGNPMNDPFGEKRGYFQYNEILNRLRKIKETIETKRANPPTTTTTSTMEVEEPPKVVETIPEVSPITTEPVPEKPPTDPPAPSAVDLDEEFARMLQEQEFSESGGYYGNKKSAYYAPDYPPKIPTNFTPVKPPSMAELVKQTSANNSESNSDYDPEIICLVCHQSPRDYIILPSCQQPHIYCMSCSNKMLNNVGTNNQYNRYNRKNRNSSNGSQIQCVLCSSISQIENLNTLRRRKKRKVETNNKCPVHDEDYCLYCMEDAEMMCIMCAGSEVHRRHNVEALDVAQKHIQSQLKTSLTKLQSKRSNLESFVEQVKSQGDKLKESTGVAISDVKSKFVVLKKLLEDKEKEYEESIRKAEARKAHEVEVEVKKAQERIDKIDQSISSASEAFSHTNSPLEFLQKIESVEEEVRFSIAAVEPQIKSKWFEVPVANLAFLEQTLKSIKYTEKTNMMPGAIYDEDSYSDEEDY